MNRLQQELAGLRGEFCKKSAEQQDHYESIIRTLQDKVSQLSTRPDAGDRQRHKAVRFRTVHNTVSLIACELCNTLTNAV